MKVPLYSEKHMFIYNEYEEKMNKIQTYTERSDRIVNYVTF
jgi:hypothetical protein